MNRIYRQSCLSQNDITHFTSNLIINNHKINNDNTLLIFHAKLIKMYAKNLSHIKEIYQRTNMNTTNIRNLWRAATIKKPSKVTDPLSGGIGHLWKLPNDYKTAVNKQPVKKAPATKKVPAEKICCICYEPMSYASETAIDNCEHTFCSGCIVQWSNNFNLSVEPGTCPMCRGNYTRLYPKNKPCWTCHQPDHPTKLCPHKVRVKEPGFRDRTRLANVDLKNRDMMIVGIEITKTYRGLIQTIINKAVNHVLHHSRVSPDSLEFDEKLNRRLFKTTGIEYDIYNRLLESTCKHLRTINGNMSSTTRRIELYRGSL